MEGMKMFTGFVAEGTEAVADLETVLYEMKAVAQGLADETYGVLLKAQIERIVDEIALGLIRRPEGTSILDVAAGEVRRRCAYAQNSSAETEFNLYAGVQVLRAPVDGKPATLLKLVAPNGAYAKRLSRVKNLIPFEIGENPGKKKATWDAIVDKYSGDVPLVSGLVDFDAIKCDPGQFAFRTPGERAVQIAREKTLNVLLSAYACGGQIEPHKLVEYFECANARLKRPEIARMIEAEAARLEGILPEITLPLVAETFDPGRPVPRTAPEAPEWSVGDVSGPDVKPNGPDEAEAKGEEENPEGEK